VKNLEYFDSIVQFVPSINDLKQIGLSEPESIEFRRASVPIERNVNIEVCLPKGEFNEFTRHYDLSKLEVGLVNFFSEPKKINELYHIGTVDGDDLIFDELKSEVKILEFGTQHVLWVCANDLDSFFRCLIIVNQFLMRCVTDEQLEYNEAEQERVISKCEDEILDKSLIDFYRMLIGSD
jgi:hypothetical protein